MKSVKSCKLAILALFAFVIQAHAVQVYSGCAVPPATPNHVWYIDAVKGSATGDGSQAHPWNSLQAVGSSVNGASPLLSTIPYRHRDATGAWVFTANPAAPIKPGDEIYLMSGNYGDIVIGSNQTVISNSAFVTVAAAPGEMPVLTSLLLMSTNHWVFNGLKIQSLKTPLIWKALIYIYDQGASYPTSDIVLQNLVVSSQDNVSSWSQSQWRSNAREGLYLAGNSGGLYTTCISVTGSRFTNVTNGAMIFSNKTLFSNNQIDHFGDDGLDYAASNLSITHNFIHDNIDIGDSNHEDAMQGQIGRLAAGTTLNYFKNILIDSNSIVRQVDPNLPFPTYLQGIDAFDEDWTNVTVTNNVVITSACWGIEYASVHNSIIANNTVIKDGLISMPGNCGPTVGVDDKTHQGPSSSNTVVRNNLASVVTVDNLDSGVTADHNVIVSINGKGMFSEYERGVEVWYSNPGTYGTSNIIDSGGAASEFVNFSPATLTYNMMLKSGAQAIGAGVTTSAPTVDIAGFTRTTPYAAGAYGYPR